MINPYKNIAGLNTFKGDLHFHSSDSDGEASAEEMFERLAKLNFSFCCLADHDIPRDKMKFHSKLLVLPGQEMSSESGHIVSLFSKLKRQENWSIKEQLQVIKDSNGFSILSHPKIREFVAKQTPTYTSKRLLCEFPGLYDGIEIYTHNVNSGFKCAIDKLDTIWSSAILSFGALYKPSFSPVWGFASSDAHTTEHITENVGIVAWMNSLTEIDLKKALKTGAFYSLANSRARFIEILEEDGVFSIKARNTIMLRAIRIGGVVAKVECTDANKIANISYKSNKTDGYIRFEAMDTNGQLAYTNPIFLGENND